MINICAKFGNDDSQEVLYSAETIRQETYSEAKLFKSQLIKKLSDANIISSQNFSLTSDIWTDPR